MILFYIILLAIAVLIVMLLNKKDDCVEFSEHSIVIFQKKIWGNFQY